MGRVLKHTQRGQRRVGWVDREANCYPVQTGYLTPVSPLIAKHTN